MTGIVMASMGHMGPRGALDTTVTVGSGIYDATVTSMGGDNYYAYGYDSGVDFFTISSFGSIGKNTYRDGGGTLRTISAIYWTQEFGPVAGEDDNIYFCLNATSIADTDTTFVAIVYNGQTYTRASATYSGTIGSCSSWRWLNVSPNPPTSGTAELVVKV